MLRASSIIALVATICLIVATLSAPAFVAFRSQNAYTEWKPTGLTQVNELTWALEDLQQNLPTDSSAKAPIVLAYRQALNLRDSLRFIRPTNPESTTNHIQTLLTEARQTLRRETNFGANTYTDALQHNLLLWSLLIATALTLVALLIGWQLYARWYKPAQTLGAILDAFARHERSHPILLADSDLYPLEHKTRSDLQTIQRLLHEGDQLASQLAQRAQGFQASRHMLELTRAIPGVVFQCEYLTDGTRIYHFISPKAHTFFDQTRAAHTTEREGASSVPLALTHSLFERAMRDPSSPLALEYDTKVENQWIRTLATTNPQSSGSTMINGVWLDVSDSIEKNQALTTAHSHAEEAAKEKARLLAVMSHEIRTPLNGILGMAQLMLKAEMPPDQRERIRKILDSGHHLMEIINDVLDLSKIESGQLVLEQAPFSLQQLIADVGDLLAPRAAEKNLELWTDVPSSLDGQWIGDPLRLRQILVNFTANALKFTQTGEVSIRARILDESAQDAIDVDSVLVLLEVHDTGIGIASQDQKNLFQAFHQTDASITRRYGGTGLGLAISSHFAQLLGGQTGVRSRPGEGSVFWFTARLKRGHAIPDTPTALHGRKVLIVEGHAGVRNTLSRTLRETFACETASVRSGQEAIQLLRTEGCHFNLCIFASRLADMSAIRLLQEIQHHRWYQGPIWVAGYPDTSEFDDLKAFTNATPLPKPLGSYVLAKACHTLCEDCTRATQEPPTPAGIALPKRRFLVVDDNALNRSIAADFLQSHPTIQAQVDLAENGRQAVDKVLEEPEGTYDAVFMDLQMPVMDGLSATRELHHLVANPPPIFAMSAHLDTEQEQEALDCGMADFVHKPLVESQLWKVLRDWEIAPTSTLHTTHEEPDNPFFSEATWQDLVRSLSAPRAQHLAEQFLAQSNQQLSALHTAVAQQDLSKASAILHQISGTAGSFGLLAAGHAATSMSQAIRAEQHDRLPALLGDLQAALEGGQASLRSLLDSATSS